MSKLKNKTFFVLTIILTILLISILVMFNANLYYSEYNELKDKIYRIENINFKPTSIIDIENNNPIFIDLKIYVVYFDNNMNILDIINYANDGLTKEEIMNIAINNIDKYNLENLNNLYFDKYYFSLNNKNELIIINNELINKKLISSIEKSIILFLILELLIIYISKLLTKWLIRPVEDSFKKQKQFIYDASHELKTPLSIIIASAESLENNISETKWLDNIKNEAERMNNLVIDLLDLAKSEELEKKEVYVELNLSKLVEKSVLTFESLIYEKGLKLEYNIKSNISYKCNESRIKQLISILIDNAIKHAYNKSKITVELIIEKNEVILLVKNRGEAIAKEKQDKIFERFYRVDSSRNRNENRYGLGLAIAKNIVTSHNGKISVSCKNGYTTFKIILK